MNNQVKLGSSLFRKKVEAGNAEGMWDILASWSGNNGEMGVWGEESVYVYL